jgi:hypothetical protein
MKRHTPIPDYSDETPEMLRQARELRELNRQRFEASIAKRTAVKASTRGLTL